MATKKELKEKFLFLQSAYHSEINSRKRRALKKELTELRRKIDEVYKM